LYDCSRDIATIAISSTSKLDFTWWKFIEGGGRKFNSPDLTGLGVFGCLLSSQFFFELARFIKAKRNGLTYSPLQQQLPKRIHIFSSAQPSIQSAFSPLSAFPSKSNYLSHRGEPSFPIFTSPFTSQYEYLKSPKVFSNYANRNGQRYKALW